MDGTHGLNPTPVYFDIVSDHMIRAKSQFLISVGNTIPQCLCPNTILLKKDFTFTCTNKLEYCLFFFFFFRKRGVYKLLGIVWYVTILSTSPLWVCSIGHVKMRRRNERELGVKRI